MKDILSDILSDKLAYVQQCKALCSSSELEKLVRPRKSLSMRAALDASQTGIIAEFKRRSPSKGWINRDADPLRTVPAYAEAGAAAVSILTDGPYFGGSEDDIVSVREKVGIPILRKEFIVDPWQVLQSRVLGADAILLIAAALTKERCAELAAAAHDLGLEVLLEIHSQSEVEYINGNVDMVGVNNRNLGTFHTDTDNSLRLADALPRDILRVSESGISAPQTIRRLREAGYKGFLIGESFMKTTAPEVALARFIEEVKAC